MDKRFSRMIESGTKLTFVAMLLFVAATCWKGHWILAAAEFLLVVLLFVYYRRRSKRRSAEIRKYVENLAFSVDDASKQSLVNFPLPTMILRGDRLVQRRFCRPVRQNGQSVREPHHRHTPRLRHPLDHGG